MKKILSGFVLSAFFVTCQAGFVEAAPSQIQVIRSDIRFLKVDPASPVKAIAIIGPTSGNTVIGRVLFEQKGLKLYVKASLKHLTPGKHGFHIHEFGDIRSVDGSTAGGHFNPLGHVHGDIDTPHHHLGDLGNIEANEAGEALYEKELDGLMLSGATSIIGRSVIVHDKQDDLMTNPSGQSGKRIGQGVIGICGQ